MNKAQIKKKLATAFQTHLNVSSQAAAGLVPAAVTDGKLYEAYVLSQVVEKLATEEKFSLVLVGGSKIALKSAPGPINRSYPRIELQRNGIRLAELWTDVEFLSLSYSQTGMSLTKGDYHELDIMIVDANAANRPPHTAIWLGIECKNTSYQKGLLKEILGIRRELSLLTDSQKTKFALWPRSQVPATPPSCLLVYSTDPTVKDYSSPGNVFGIDFFYEPL